MLREVDKLVAEEEERWCIWWHPTHGTVVVRPPRSVREWYDGLSKDDRDEVRQVRRAPGAQLETAFRPRGGRGAPHLWRNLGAPAVLVAFIVKNGCLRALPRARAAVGGRRPRQAAHGKSAADEGEETAPAPGGGLLERSG